MAEATCSICKHPKRRQIEAALLAGDSLRRIAKQFGVSDSAVFRHKKKCIKEAVQSVQEERKQETGNFILDRLSRAAALIDEALKRVWGEADADKDVEKLLKVLAEDRQQNRLYADLLHDKTVDELAAHLAEMEQQLEALLSRKLA